MKVLATLGIVAAVYVVGVVVHLVSFLTLVEVRQRLKLDQPVHFYYTGRIETHGADEMAVFGALFTSLLS